MWKNGDKYEGHWKACLKHGKGTDRFANGDSYKGEFNEGKPHGKGIYKWKNGSIYKGEFFNGMKQGKGIWKKKTKNGIHVYNGNKLTYLKLISLYFYISVGQYHADNREGYGEMLWADGSSYKGRWVNGVPHGKGKMI